MELAEIRPFEPRMAEIDLFTMPDAVGVGEPSVHKVKPYIAGHVTDGSSTFTFKVNGNDVTVSVSGGNWKYKPTTAITSLAFVGVPQLESLELNKITGVSTFNLDYPVVPVFKNCDTTTEAALDYVYHIRGTATENFSFTLKYIDENNTTTQVMEVAVIDENGKYDVSYSGKKIRTLEGTFRNNKTFTSVEFTEDMDKCTSVRSNDNYAFDGCTNLTSALFPNATFGSVDKCGSTGGGLFMNCSSLTEVDLSKATFNSATDFQRMFSGCSALLRVDLSSVTFNSATSVGTLYRGMFNGCTSLQRVIFKNGLKFNTITSAVQVFKGCSSLLEVNLDDAEFKNVTDIQQFFDGCTSLQSMDLSKATFEKVENCASIFNDCTALKSANLHNATFEVTTTAGNMFDGCTNVETIDLSSATFELTTNIWRSFRNCSKLTQLYISNATCENVSVAQELFTNCASLTTLNIGAMTFGDSLTNFNYVFNSDILLKDLYVPQSATMPLGLNFTLSPLSYDSMLRVAGWLKDLTGGTAQTVTFKAATYNALTAEQKAELTRIIVTEKGWNLATA